MEPETPEIEAIESIDLAAFLLVIGKRCLGMTPGRPGRITFLFPAGEVREAEQRMLGGETVSARDLCDHQRILRRRLNDMKRATR